MKVIFIHYSFQQDGVTRTVLNNIKGLKKIKEDINFILLGNNFSEWIPKEIKKRKINWDSINIVEELEKLTSDCDIVVIENPVVGVLPEVTIAFKKFAEQSSKKIIYRIHDFIDDRPHLIEKFNQIIPEGIDNIYPTSDRISFVVLTSTDKRRLLEKGLENVSVIPNSIVSKELFSDKERSIKLKEFLKEKGIIKEEKILLYPVRLEKRKNIEEAMLITKILNNSGENYKLIVTIPFLEDYREKLMGLANEFKIPCSLGEVSKYIGFDEEGFGIGDLYSISDLVISTSVREGFGFTFIEPWILGTPIIGRDLPDVTDDFKQNGINLNHLYGNSIFPTTEDFEERMNEIKLILSDENKMEKLSETLGLKERITSAMKVVKENKKAVINSYDYVNVAQKLLEQMGVEARSIVSK